MFTWSIQDPYFGNSGAKNSEILRFCLLEKRMQCRKLDSFNKLLLIDYLQLRIEILKLCCSSGDQTWNGGAQNLHGGRAPLSNTLVTTMSWTTKWHNSEIKNQRCSLDEFWNCIEVGRISEFRKQLLKCYFSFLLQSLCEQSFSSDEKNHEKTASKLLPKNVSVLSWKPTITPLPKSRRVRRHQLRKLYQTLLQWFLTWGKLTRGCKFQLSMGKFTES